MDYAKDTKTVITSLDGRKVMSKSLKNGQNQINVSQLAKGAYILNAEG